MTTIAYPLLVLAVTHSPAKAGFVGFARLVPFAAFGLLTGVAADANRPRAGGSRWGEPSIVRTGMLEILTIGGVAIAV